MKKINLKRSVQLTVSNAGIVRRMMWMLVIPFFMLFIAPEPLLAQAHCTNQQNCAVTPSGTSLINAHGLCRSVTNRNSNPIMVPTNSVAEWVVGLGNSFLTNVPFGVEIGFCEVRTVVSGWNCSSISSGRTVQSYFSASDWSNAGMAKVLVIPHGCNACRTSGLGTSAMSVGSSWAGDLTVIVSGALSGGTIATNRSDAQRIVAFDANSRGTDNQRMNLIVDGGSLVSGGRDGVTGATAPSSTAWGQICYGGGGMSYPYCNASMAGVPGGQGGAGGRGEHCGTPARAGQAGLTGNFVHYRSDYITSGQTMISNWDHSCGCIRNQWVMTYSAVRRYSYATGGRGGAGQHGLAATSGIRNPNNANISIRNGGSVRGM